MTTRTQQARLFNQAIAQGLTEEQALEFAGITDSGDFTFGVGGQLEPLVLGPGRRSNETTVPPGANIDYGDDDDRQFVTRPVSNRVTSTSLTSVTGGSVRTTTVTPTTYRDTESSLALQADADKLQVEKEARAAELRAQGKTGAEILRDPRYREISSAQQDREYQSQQAKTVDRAGTATVVVTPGQTGTEFGVTVDGDFLTNDTSGYDEQVQLQDLNRRPPSPGPLNTGRDIVSDGDPGYSGGGFVYDDNGELIPANSARAEVLAAEQVRVRAVAPAAVGGNYVESYDVETGTFGVFDVNAGIFVETGLTQQEAILQAQEFAVGDRGYGATARGGGDTGLTPGEIAQQQRQTAAQINAANAQALKQQAQIQATLQNQYRQADSGDWRFKIRLAPGARYLYRGRDGNGTGAGILAPLNVTDGVVFPYTPQVTTAYRANYSNQDLTHSNYRGYFYQSSYVDTLQVTGTFTAQDTSEANYLLAVIHFFRSATKMFYGQDEAFRGAPPPVVFIQGLGVYQFNRHPCVISSFNYVLPNDVDYIRADVQPISGLGIQQARQQADRRQNTPTNIFSAALKRLSDAGLPRGGVNIPPDPGVFGTISPTYVPTKMDITVELMPTQSRSQVSREFSLEKYSNGNLQRGGFW